MAESIELKETPVDTEQERLEAAIADTKEKLNDYINNEENHPNLPPDRGIIREFQSQIYQYERELTTHLVRKEIQPIQSFFDAIKEKLEIDEENSSIEISVTKYKNLRHALFHFSHHTGKIRREALTYFDWYLCNCMGGDVIYDVNGNILLDTTHEWEGATHPIINEKIYKLIDLNNKAKETSIFLDDDYVIIEHRDVNLYKRIDGKYEKIHTFLYDEGYHVMHTSSLWAEKLLIHGKRLYNLDKNEYLTDMDFDALHPYDSEEFPSVIDWHDKELSKDFEDTTREKLKNHKWLIGTKKIVVKHLDRRVEAPTFCYLNTNGTIVGKLHVIIYGKMTSFEVKNETYNTIIGEIKEVIKKQIEKMIAKENAAKRRKENQMTKKRRQLLEAIKETNE